MSIRWDTLLTRHTARELDRSLVGTRLRAVRLDRSTRDLTLVFKDRTLIWRLHPSRGYLRLLGSVEPAEDDHRIRSTLQRVTAPPDERVIRFDFSATRSGSVSVIVELMSTRWNAVVTEGDSDVVRHILWRPSKDTRRVIGQSYVPPDPTGRSGASGDVSLNDWLAQLEPLPPSERPRALLRTFAWTSPLNAAALLGDPREPGIEPGTEPDLEPDLELGFRRWSRMVDPEVPLEPVLLDLATGPQPYPFPLPDVQSRAVDTLLAAFEAGAEADGEGGRASPSAVLGPELLGRMKQAVRQASRRLRRLEAELEGLDDPQRLRGVGDLILARYHEIPSGAVLAHLVGFDGEPVEVRIERGEPAHASAARYYQGATKAERAEKRLPGLIDEVRTALSGLESLLERVRAGDADEAEVRDTLGPSRTAKRGDSSGRSLPYKTFRSSGGLEIRVGRGARFNDDLTFRHSSSGDVWLHARQTSGAHVILRWPGDGRPPARDLEEAAILAALHSKARTSGSVPVDWTVRKYVRKPRKSPPGQVTVEREETLFVEPDASLLEALAERSTLA
jgi:predicted ribosome quality control (RQC) complex YloA/Tae2 family protein